MQAVNQTTYGAPDVLSLVDRERPQPKAGEVLVKVCASEVTQGDRRLRAADFPGISGVLGRLMMGVFRPRRQTPGTTFAGTVEALGGGVTEFAVGDKVFGTVEAGAHAEFVVARADGAMASMPRGMSFEDAAMLPYGALTAVAFLEDIAKVRPGERVLVVGAAGGVGRLATQLAAHLGAHVTAVVGEGAELVRSLGATEVIDYRSEDFTRLDRTWDVIFDTSGTATFGRSRRVLTPNGRFATTFMSAGVLWHMARTAVFGRQRAYFGMALGTRAQFERVRDLAEAGAFRGVVDRRYELRDIVAAHARLEASRPAGSVIIALAA